MKKKILALLLAVASFVCLAVGLSACGGKIGSGNQQAPGQNEEGNADNGNQQAPGQNEEDNTEVAASDGLEFTLSNDGQSYIVSKVGTCKDTNVIIPSKYKGKPVLSSNQYYLRIKRIRA